MILYPDNVDNIDDYYKALDSFYVYGGDKEDRIIQKSLRVSGMWNPELTSFLINTVKPGWKCLDIGSSNGYFAEVMGRLAGPSGSVIGFEPLKRLVNLYEDGRKLNDYSSCAPITMHPFGLSNETKTAEIRIVPHNIGGSYVPMKEDYKHPESWGEYSTEEVGLKRLDDFYDDTPDIIKINIGNYEKFAFEGFSENTLKCPLIIAELGGGQPVSFLNYLTRNYNMYNLAGLKTNAANIIGEDFVYIVLRKK